MFSGIVTSVPLLCVCAHVRARLCVLYQCLCMYECGYLCVCICGSVSTCMPVSVCLCVCVLVSLSLDVCVSLCTWFLVLLRKSRNPKVMFEIHF